MEPPLQKASRPGKKADRSMSEISATSAAVFCRNAEFGAKKKDKGFSIRKEDPCIRDEALLSI